MQTKKRKMKPGEALVGMKRSGSQLWARCGQLWFASSEPRREAEGRQWGTYLRKQNMMPAV